MNKSVAGLLVAGSLALVSLSSLAAAPGTQPDEAKIDTLISRMTLQEKANQLSILGADHGDLDKAIAQGLGGTNGVIPDIDVQQYTKAKQQVAMTSRLKIPLWFMGDVNHGFRILFPMPLAMAASFDTDLATRVARAGAEEATAAGVTWTFSPMMDISRDPRWGRGVEGAGEDPYLGTRMALAQLEGYQGNDLAASDTMMATAKHFAGYGAVGAGRDYNATSIPSREFRDVYLPPFKAVADAGIGSIMAAFITLDGVPATGDRALQTGILRDSWHYHGLVVSDYDAVKELETHGIARNDADAARIAINAGIDVDLHSGVYAAQLPGLVRSGKVSMARLNQAVRRVLEAKARLGLFDNPFRYGGPARVAKVTLTPAKRKLAREAARETMVLLKNDGVLPLEAKGRIAVIGPLADNQRDLQGVMPALGKPQDVVSVLAGMREAVGDRATISYAQGVTATGDDVSGIPAAVAAARNSDVAVLVLGESHDIYGEGDSRSSIKLPGRQQALVEAVLATGKPVVAVVMSGRALDLSWLDQHVSAIVEAWVPGDEGGPALADLLFGKANFSGKLPVTFPRSLGQVPLYYDHLPTGRPGDQHTTYTSRYVDLPNTPLYPFGYGLSYTSFRFGVPKVDHETLNPDGTLIVSEEVTNVGKRAGTAVVQFYVHDRIADVSRPVRELKGFKRVALAPGETRQITFSLSPKDLAFARLDGSWGTEAGRYDIYVGEDSTASATTSFMLARSERMGPGMF
ncbi:MAG: glycoside hydrolase family 3 N-terminal domain-containing protein [Sphingomonadaceae bacterium]